jgi:hydroxyacylglutathione hydrolase
MEVAVLFLKCLDNGMVDSNCYVLGDSGEAVVIDAGVDYSETARILESEGLALKYIILTHAHIDHVLQADNLRNTCGGKVVIHKDDAPLLDDGVLNGSFLFGLNRTFGQADLCVSDGDILELGRLKLEIIHTPGHTPGSMCIRVDDCLFTGDTLFKLGIGRTDLGAGDYDLLMASLRKLMELDDNVIVYPGHGPATDIGYERKHNRWL